MFDVLVLKRIEEQVIRSVTETPLDMEELERLPGIVGYIVQPGDSMWGIAKKFRTTQESVKKVNGLDSDLLKPGQRLLVLKEVEEML
jgi:ATP-dependent 26S proteasome regulatory subunit